MLAHAVRRRLEAAGVDYAGTDRELDICDSAAVSAFIQAERFTHVVNCAAFTQVDEAETKSDLAHRVNVTGPKHLAEASARSGAHFVHISTDYVFDGEGTSPYTEDAPCAPRSVYGMTKLAGERHVLDTLDAVPSSTNRSVQIVRTSWLFGEHGGNFVATMLKLMEQRDELRVVQDQVGRPTYTMDLAAAILLLVGALPGRAPCTSGVYHFANAGSTTWWDFSREILRLGRQLGWDLKTRSIVPVTTGEFPRPAPRPAYSVLDTSRFENAAGYSPRPWPEALAE